MTTATWLCGKFMIEGALVETNRVQLNADGTMLAMALAALNRLKLVGALELLGCFAVIFTSMILMRFGL